MFHSVCALAAVAIIIIISGGNGHLHSSTRRHNHYCRRLKRDIKVAIKTHCHMHGAPTVSTGRDCADLYTKGIRANGVYQIRPYPSGANARKTVSVYCDMKTDGGGWTVFQRRFNGNVDFYRTWATYKAGFGKASGEYWLGNDVIHALTIRASELRVDLQDWKDKKAYAKYDIFSVAGSDSKYRLRASTYSGTAGDSLTKAHNGQQFTTYDNDNDKNTYGRNCAKDCHGAWWYNTCHSANLNGRYYYSGVINASGVTWSSWQKTHESLMRTEMKVRPRGFSG